MNTDVLWPEPEWAEMQVLRIQTKLHQWASVDPDRRFDDLFNLVYDPAVLVVAWARVRGQQRETVGGCGRHPTGCHPLRRGGVLAEATRRSQGAAVRPFARADDPQTRQ